MDPTLAKMVIEVYTDRTGKALRASLETTFQTVYPR